MRRPVLLLILACAAPAPGLAQAVRVAAVTPRDADEWSRRIERAVAASELALRQARADTLLPGRRHERFTQLHRGVPVFGGELVRQSLTGQTVSVFGTLYQGIELDPRPVLGEDAARRVVEQAAGVRLGPDAAPQLLVLPLPQGSYALAYSLRAFARGDLRLYFVDARSGAVLRERSDLWRDAAVGLGTGVLGDRKKVSTDSRGGEYTADDRLRPPALRTYDMKGDLGHLYDVFNGAVPLTISDLARDADNDWDDGASVDGHAYAGWVYDFLYQRFGRRGLDDRDIAITSLVHPVNREDVFDYSDDVVGTFYLNAAYLGGGWIFYGEGLPGTLTAGGRRWNYLAGGLDVVAHELAHGVTEFSSNLIYEGEPGALNEAFSDILGTSTEFFFQPPGTARLQADYLLGEDVISPGGIRSMENPGAYGDPDHYSARYTGPEDNGGVHINSGIPNQAFYLAVEGGTNRTSGRSVRGVGAGNREQVEKTFYRAFVFLLPPSADFALARAATLQSARDLYGTGSAAEQALDQAWTAVGVN